MIVVLAFSVATGGAEITTVIDFNNLATPESSTANWGVIPASYAGLGLTWTGWEVVDGQSFNDGYGSIFSGPFPNNAAYNGGDGNLTVSIASVNAFDVISADFSTWIGFVDPQFEATDVTITGYLGETQVGTPVAIPLVSGFVTTPINISGVTEVDFTSSAPNQYWLMDNLTVVTTPEPDASFLYFAGIAFLVLARRIRPRRH